VSERSCKACKQLCSASVASMDSSSVDYTCRAHARRSWCSCQQRTATCTLLLHRARKTAATLSLCSAGQCSLSLCSRRAVLQRGTVCRFQHLAFYRCAARCQLIVAAIRMLVSREQAGYSHAVCALAEEGAWHATIESEGQLVCMTLYLSCRWSHGCANSTSGHGNGRAGH
jgi:hypothetical protein